MRVCLLESEQDATASFEIFHVRQVPAKRMKTRLPQSSMPLGGRNIEGHWWILGHSFINMRFGSAAFLVLLCFQVEV